MQREPSLFLPVLTLREDDSAILGHIEDFVSDYTCPSGEVVLREGFLDPLTVSNDHKGTREPDCEDVPIRFGQLCQVKVDVFEVDLLKFYVSLHHT